MEVQGCKVCLGYALFNHGPEVVGSNPRQAEFGVLIGLLLR